MARTLPNTFPDLKNPSKYHVYFQPDQNTKLAYPAIVYERDRIDMKHANDSLYSHTKRYRITVIDRNPDSLLPDAVMRLPMTSYMGHNKRDGLNHDIYATYF